MGSRRQAKSAAAAAPAAAAGQSGKGDADQQQGAGTIVKLLQQQLQQHTAATNAAGAAQLTLVWRRQQADIQNRMHTGCTYTREMHAFADSWLKGEQQQQQQQQLTAAKQQQQEAELFQKVLQALEEEVQDLEKQAAAEQQQQQQQQPPGPEATAKTLQQLRKGRLLQRGRLFAAADADTYIYSSSSDDDSSSSSSHGGWLLQQQQRFAAPVLPLRAALRQARRQQQQQLRVQLLLQQWLRSTSLHALQQQQLLLSSGGLGAAIAAAAVKQESSQQIQLLQQQQQQLIKPRKELRLWQTAAASMSTPGCSFVELLLLRSSSSSSKSAVQLLLSKSERKVLLQQLKQQQQQQQQIPPPPCFLSHGSAALSCSSCFFWLLLQQQELQQLQQGTCAARSGGAETNLVKALVLQQQLLLRHQQPDSALEEVSPAAAIAAEAAAAEAAAAAAAAADTPEFSIKKIEDGRRVYLGSLECIYSSVWGGGYCSSSSAAELLLWLQQLQHMHPLLLQQTSAPRSKERRRHWRQQQQLLHGSSSGFAAVAASRAAAADTAAAGKPVSQETYNASLFADGGLEVQQDCDSSASETEAAAAAAAAAASAASAAAAAAAAADGCSCALCAACSNSNDSSSRFAAADGVMAYKGLGFTHFNDSWRMQPRKRRMRLLPGRQQIKLLEEQEQQQLQQQQQQQQKGSSSSTKREEVDFGEDSDDAEDQTAAANGGEAAAAPAAAAAAAAAADLTVEYSSSEDSFCGFVRDQSAYRRFRRKLVSSPASVWQQQQQRQQRAANTSARGGEAQGHVLTPYLQRLQKAAAARLQQQQQQGQRKHSKHDETLQQLQQLSSNPTPGVYAQLSRSSRVSLLRHRALLLQQQQLGKSSRKRMRDSACEDGSCLLGLETTNMISRSSCSSSSSKRKETRLAADSSRKVLLRLQRKPRVRSFEPRWAINSSSNSSSSSSKKQHHHQQQQQQLGVAAAGEWMGRQVFLAAVDEAKAAEVLPHAKIYQDNLRGMTATLASRREYCVIIDEKTNTLSIAPCGRLSFFLQETPEQRTSDFFAAQRQEMKRGADNLRQSFFIRSLGLRSLLNNNCHLSPQELKHTNQARLQLQQTGSWAAAAYAARAVSTTEEQLEVSRQLARAAAKPIRSEEELIEFIFKAGRRSCGAAAATTPTAAAAAAAAAHGISAAMLRKTHAAAAAAEAAAISLQEGICNEKMSCYLTVRNVYAAQQQNEQKTRTKANLIAGGGNRDPSAGLSSAALLKQLTDCKDAAAVSGGAAGGLSGAAAGAAAAAAQQQMLQQMLPRFNPAATCIEELFCLEDCVPLELLNDGSAQTGIGGGGLAKQLRVGGEAPGSAVAAWIQSEFLRKKENGSYVMPTELQTKVLATIAWICCALSADFKFDFTALLEDEFNNRKNSNFEACASLIGMKPSRTNKNEYQLSFPSPLVQLEKKNSLSQVLQTLLPDKRQRRR
ncbi:hypothetical protein, conserved [Eimeria maxima]|uniref:Uncharacterized protein n=1 Tax=Eimeria maxima TaxID=5804 RepID=U6M8A1_EIMMA|nr:hypothetical protein, conserved [Eimeria maxima]CDJ60437.1 hypothetical protein, conserved [Eimeria maxima]